MLRSATLALAIALGSAGLVRAQPADPLPSWRDGAAKRAILTFVARVSSEGSPSFVDPADRIATFDNDGTLWAEQPLYVQLLFAIDRVRALAPQHPEWREQEPFASLLRGDIQSALAGGERAVVAIVMASHAGMTTEEFDSVVKQWIATARNPVTGRSIAAMTYQPMLELLTFLRAHRFKTFIVSGGGVEFMRAWSEALYGIPPEQVIGSSIRTRFEIREGRAVLVRLPEINLVDDKEAKPIAIQDKIGRRPLAAFGNSDGDLPMLQWTTSGTGPRFGLLVHHTDGVREWAYDRTSSIGRLDQGLEAARRHGWTVVDIRRDWRTVYPALPLR